jgi:xenotropic and polytropic retrovirus receptor 1
LTDTLQIKAFQHEARFWLLRILFRIFTAPFWSVGFADFWLADQLNSLVYALMDFHFFICFFISNPDWESYDRNTGMQKSVDIIRV